MERSLQSQRGVSLGGVVMACMVIGAVSLLGMKVAPDFIEYFAVLKTVKATATDPKAIEGGVSGLRKSFDNRASVDRIESLKGEDLDITKEGEQVVIAFAYSKKIPLFKNISLMVDFRG